jgi:isochorismate pyruvate lyase
MKAPEQCGSMADIRVEIDRLDRQIVALLGQRFSYVKAASKFKTSETTVRAPERLQSMLQQRRTWAEEEGLNADVIEKMYQDLVNHFIDEEMQHWKQHRAHEITLE